MLLLLSACDRSESKPRWELSSDWVEKGPVRAKLELKRASISILEQQDLKLTVQSQANVRVQTPMFIERLEDFRLVPWRGDLERDIEGMSQLEKHVRFESFESGPQSLPPFAITFVEGSGNQSRSGQIDLPSLSFSIEGIDDPALVQQPLEDHQELHQGAPGPWSRALWWAVPALAGLIAALIWWSKRAKKSAPPPPPEPAHRWAWRALEGLVQEQKEGLDNETFVDRITLILRVYIEKRYGIHAPEQTTEEFLSLGLKPFGELEQHQSVIKQFLEYADLIKFAGQSAKAEDVQQGFDFLKSLISATQEQD